MSGICGIVDLSGSPVTAGRLEAMASASEFREQAGRRIRSTGGIGFVHQATHHTPWAALERQPRFDGRLWLTGDFRLVDRESLKVALGLDDSTDALGDDALVLEAYRAWGEDCVDHLVGDFAFALWDSEPGRLFCARDPAGVKPLHYAETGSALYFASDASQILASGEISPDLDGTALMDLLLGVFHAPERSAYAAIRRVPPGCCLTWAPGALRVRRYWRPDRRDPILHASEEAYVEEFRELLDRVISDHGHTAEGRVAVMTSGGLDSSSLAALIQKRSSGRDPNSRPIAVTHAFERFSECDETRYVRRLVDETGIEHAVIPVEDHSGFEAARDSAADHPSCLGGDVSSETFRTLERLGAGVVFWGFGGDSLFDASRLQFVDHARNGRWGRLLPWMRAARREGRGWVSVLGSFVVAPLLPREVKRWLDRARGRHRLFHVPEWISADVRDHLDVDRRVRPEYPRRFRSFARQRQYEYVVGLAQQGPAIDGWSFRGAQAGIDARFPFLDRRLAEYLLAVPLTLGARPGSSQTKFLLRRAMSEDLPVEIRQRSDKISWRPWIRHLLLEEWRDDVRALLHDSKLGELGLVDGPRLLDHYDELTGREPQGAELGRLSFVLLMERWLRSHASISLTVRFDDSSSMNKNSLQGVA